jgi:hypothetical protein
MVNSPLPITEGKSFAHILSFSINKITSIQSGKFTLATLLGAILMQIGRINWLYCLHWI